MLELLLGLQSYLNSLTPVAKLVYYAISGIVMLTGVLLIAIASAWKAKKAYGAEESTTGDIAKQSVGAAGVMANIVGIFAVAVALLSVGAPLILGIVVAVLKAIAKFVPGVELPPGF